MVFPPLFSLSKSEDFAHGRDFLELITQMYLIYSEKIPSDCEIARYLLDDHSVGSFCVLAKHQGKASCECFISDSSLAVIG